MNDPSAAIWEMGVSPWIIQDGNYGDFAVGDETAFALEFYSERGLSRVYESQIRAQHTGDSHFEVTAKVEFGSPECWGIDFGVLAFREDALPTEFAVGDFLRGSIYLGIDPFFYFERLCKMAKIPPLVYDWQIKEIQIEAMPLIQHPTVPRTLVGDLTRKRREPVSRTDAWSETSATGWSLHYNMCCKLIGGPRLPKTPGSQP